MKSSKQNHLNNCHVLTDNNQQFNGPQAISAERNILLTYGLISFDNVMRRSAFFVNKISWVVLMKFHEKKNKIN